MGISKTIWAVLIFFLAASCAGMIYFRGDAYWFHAAFSAVISFGAVVAILLLIPLLLRKLLGDPDADDWQFPK